MPRDFKYTTRLNLIPIVGESRMEILWSIPILQTSLTRDFADRTDTEKQSGTAGTYSDTLTLKTKNELTVYIQAHAKVDGNSYTSPVVTRTLQVK